MPVTPDSSASSNDSQWLSVAAARDAILGAIAPVQDREAVALRAGFEPALARDIVAPFDVPAHDNPAMDGYAVRGADLQAGAANRLTVVGTAMAGSAFSGQVGPGQAVRVMTGAVLPRGTDTVVIQEVVRRLDNAIEVPAGQRTGQNTRRAGADLPRGAVALARGKRLAAAEVGLLASLGIAKVAVFRRPRVAFLSTGDELASVSNCFIVLPESGGDTAAGDLVDVQPFEGLW